jgi:hypothetical protein
VVVTSDGRRVHVPIDTHESAVLSLIRFILVGLEGLVGLLIAGSRRENGGTRRSDRN